MKAGTRRFTALLCAFCMLFTSIPSSVMSDSLTEEIQVTTATPTDLQPVETEGSITPSEIEDEAPQDETPELPQADKELEAGDDLTVTGELTETKKESLIRFSPEKNQTMVLVLTADKELKATVQNENTGDRETFEKDHTDEDGTTTWIVADYKTEKENTYLLRISGEEPAEFTLRLVRKSIFEQEQETEEFAGEPTDESGDGLSEQSADNPGEENGEAANKEPGEESGEQATGGTAEESAEEPAETPDGQTAGETTDNTTDDTTEETDQPETLETTEDENANEPEEKEKPAADREITAGDDVTVSGEMNSSGEYLIRFTPDMDLTLYLILTAENAQATVTDEQTNSTKQFTPDNTVEEEKTVLTVPFYKIKNSNSYLIRISGTGEFTVRLVRSSILKAEANRQDEPEEATDPETDPDEAPEEIPAEEPEEKQTEETEESLTEESEEIQTEEPEEISTEELEDNPTEGTEENPAETELEETEENPAEESAEESAAEPEEIPEEPEIEPETAPGMTEEPEAEPEQAEEETSETPAAQAEPEIAEEAETPATQTDLKPVEEEIPATQTDLQPVEEETPASQTDLEPVEEAPVEVRIEATDSDIEAYILFLSNAGIPEGTELQVRELTPEEQEAYQAQTAHALNAEDESYLRYTKYLEFTLVHDGWAIPLNAPAKVYVTLPDINEGADALQVVRFDNMTPVLLDSERLENTVSFETEGFDVFGIGNALVPVTDHENELVKVEVLSFSEDAPVNLTEAEAPEVIEGLEVLGTFTIEDNTEVAPEAETQDGLFIKAELKEDAELDPMEGVALYSVDEDGNTEILMEQLTEDAIITELEATQVAVIKDTGYRHLTLTVNPDETTDDQIVTLDGMMPKDAEAAVEDVTIAHAKANSMGLSEENYTAEEYAETDEESETTEQIEEVVQAEAEIASEMLTEERPETETEGSAAEPKTEEGEETAEDTGEEPVNQADEAEAEPEEEPKAKLIAAYNITILNGEEEYQPGEDKPIMVEILDNRITTEKNIELWHILDNGSEIQVRDFSLEEGKITFEATGFSVYVIAEGPEPYEQPSETKVANLQELSESYDDPMGFYLSITKNNGTYFKNTISNGVITTTTGVQNAGAWFLEAVSGQANKYYLYTNTESGVKYLTAENANNNNVKFTDDAQTVFEFSEGKTSNSFNIKINGVNKWLQYSNTGGGFRFWTDKNNSENSDIALTYVSSLSKKKDPFELDGKTYGLLYYNTGTRAYAIMSQKKGASSVEGLSTLVRNDPLNQSQRLFVAKDTNISLWTFVSIESDLYYLVCNGQYLKITGNSVTITDTPDKYCKIQVIPGAEGSSNEGKIRLAGDETGKEIKVSISNDQGYFTYANQNSGNWINLAELSVYDDSDFVLYSARKVSIADLKHLTEENAQNPDIQNEVINGAKVVIFTRVWDDTKKEYEHFAIDQDGNFFRVYESGDLIQWVGTQFNGALWEFTEYYNEGTNVPNNYYELQNTNSGKYLAPQMNGSILSDTTVGINMEGRKYGENYSTILAWDDPYYAYVGLKANDDNISVLQGGPVEACAMNEADAFHFAIMEEIEHHTLTTVSTVNNHDYGIEMKMMNFNNKLSGNRDSVQTSFFGKKDNDQTGLLSTNLDGDYPKTTMDKTGHVESLDVLFDDMQEVNHLFIQSIYNEGGYFVFDSTKNYAYLGNKSDFTVYDQLATVGAGATIKNSYRHGQFFPYNAIADADGFTPLYSYSDLFANTYTGTNTPLPDDDPRKGEALYAIPSNSIDYFFGMEMKASFTQTPSGKDNWGHDVIFQFSGDDDFWLYVDGELVLDLGGVHSAMSGSINFRTGEVSLPSDRGGETNLRAVFEGNYRSRNPQATDDEVADFLAQYFDPGENVFSDYTVHTMRMFYMERGAGASNLYMRFNLAAVKPGQIMLSKSISGTDNADFQYARYPFQVYYQETEDGPFKRLTDRTGSNTHYNIVNQRTNTPITYAATYTPPGATVSNQYYEDVFFLKPGQTAVINVPEDTIKYYIVECGINPIIYDHVRINNSEMQGENSPCGGNLLDYSTSISSVNERPAVTYDNHVSPDAIRTLTFTKKLYDENDQLITKEQDPTRFSFRLSLGAEGSEPTLTYMQPYYVRDPDKAYCKWNYSTGQFESIGVDNYDNLTDEQKQQIVFYTSPNGSISKIPSQYSVEVRDLLVGTCFMVEEWDNEIPKGYALRTFTEDEKTWNGYYRVGETYIELDGIVNKGEIRNINVAEMEIHNRRGWGLTVKKEWTDTSFMSSHDPIYIAIYADGELVPGTVRQLTGTSCYYYFTTLNGKDFSQYLPYEVELTNPVVGTDGYVTSYGTITPKGSGDTITINGIPRRSTASKPFNYIVDYETGEPTGAVIPNPDDPDNGQTIANLRTDTIKNTRSGGIILRKTDMNDNDGQKLKGAVFTLKQGETPVGEGTYISDKNGLITILYDFKYSDEENEVWYTLTEVTPPSGYQGIQTPFVFKITGENTIESTGGDGAVDVEYVDTQGDGLIANVCVKNRQFTLQAIKIDAEVQTLELKNAHFALYRQMKDKNGNLRKDYYPMSGYEDLVTADEGIIPKLDMTLAPGTYYLTEKKAPSGYVRMTQDIVFTISDQGFVTLEGNLGRLDTDMQTDPAICAYTLYVSNRKLEMAPPYLNVGKHVTGSKADKGKAFEFTVSGLIPDEDYLYRWYSWLEDNWVQDTGDNPGGMLTADDNGEVTFTLHNGKGIKISVKGTETGVVVSENNDEYTASYILNESTTPAEGNSVENLTLYNDVTVVFTNTLEDETIVVAPTSYSTRHMPFILLLAFGAMFLTLGSIGLVRKKKRMPDTGPAKAKVQSHRQWVDYRTPLVRGAPPSAPPCPRADLGAKPTGSTGKRGDPGL